MVDAEYNSRKTNRLKRLIHNAGFDQPEAYIGDMNYTSGRKGIAIFLKPYNDVMHFIV